MLINAEDVKDIILEVSEQNILPWYQRLSAEKVRQKRDRSYVTIADTQTENALSEKLRKLLPGSKVIGEEDYEHNSDIFDLFKSDMPLWIIDPIDGTGNFVKGIPYFGSMIALAKNNEVLSAWIFNPLTSEFITAEKGSGAYYNSERLHVLDDAPINSANGMFYDDAVLESGNNNLIDFKPRFNVPIMCCCHEYAHLVLSQRAFGKEIRQMHFMGLGALATPWDLAACVLIHQEAGGYSSFWDETPFSLSAFSKQYKKGFLSAPSKDMWDSLKKWIVENAKINF